MRIWFGTDSRYFESGFKEMRIVLYIRISTDKKYGKQDPETQRMPLLEYCTRQGWEITKEYVDDVSAVKLRPQFEQMLKDARKRKFDAIVCVKLDRMFRSTYDFSTTTKDLADWGIRLICTDQSIDTNQQSAAGKLLMSIIADVAEFERALIKERVKAGIARRQAQGKKFGGRTPKLVTSPVLGNCIRMGTGDNKVLFTVGEVQKMRLTMGIEEIAKKLRCGRNLVAKFLKSI